MKRNALLGMLLLTAAPAFAQEGRLETYTERDRNQVIQSYHLRGGPLDEQLELTRATSGRAQIQPPSYRAAPWISDLEPERYNFARDPYLMPQWFHPNGLNIGGDYRSAATPAYYLSPTMHPLYGNGIMWGSDGQWRTW